MINHLNSFHKIYFLYFINPNKFTSVIYWGKKLKKTNIYHLFTIAIQINNTARIICRSKLLFFKKHKGRHHY